MHRHHPREPHALHQHDDRLRLGGQQERDPRDRLVQETKGDGTNTSYFNPAGSGTLGLDPSGNIVQEQIVSGGVTTSKNYTYSGNLLQKVNTNGVDSLYWYNNADNPCFVTTTPGPNPNYPNPPQTPPP